MGKKSGSGIRNEQPGSYFLELRNHIFGLKQVLRIHDIMGWIRILLFLSLTSQDANKKQSFKSFFLQITYLSQ